MTWTVGTLFSGIGGLDLGLERAGWSVRWQCEADPWCRRVLARHWPGIPIYPDARDLPGDVEPVDLIAGGFPCQPVSLAGRLAGQADPRWLWPAFAGVVRRLRPRLVLVENVPGLLVRGLGDVLGDLARAGYDAEWFCLSAADVGAPHLRRRVFVVAHAESQPVGAGLRQGGAGGVGWGRSGHSGGADGVADAHGVGRDGPGGWDVPPRSPAKGHGAWPAEPGVGRMAYGIPGRVDRLRGLGNAVVPQVAEVIGRWILEVT